MARIVPSHLITSISGKLCKQDTTYIGVNKYTGKMYSAWYHGCSQPNSDEQQAVKATFKKKSQHKIGNPYSFMRSLVTDDLKVILAGDDITGGVSAGGSTAAGGGSTTEGAAPKAMTSWKTKAPPPMRTLPTAGTGLTVDFLLFGQEHYANTDFYTTMRAEGCGVDGVIDCCFSFFLNALRLRFFRIACFFRKI